MDFSWIDTVLGAVVAGLFMWAGQLRTTNSKPKPYVPPPEPEAICGCEHHYAYHGEDGACTHLDSRYYYTAGTKKGGHPPCRCKKYVGPEPMPRYIS